MALKATFHENSGTKNFMNCSGQLATKYRADLHHKNVKQKTSFTKLFHTPKNKLDFTHLYEVLWERKENMGLCGR